MGTATHSSILAWRISWTEEPGGLQSIGSQSQPQLKRLTHTHTRACTIRYRTLLLQSSPGTATVHLTVAPQKVSDSGPSCKRIQQRREVGDANWSPVGRASCVAGLHGRGLGTESTRQHSLPKRVFASVGLSVKGTPGFKMSSAQVQCMRQCAQGWCTGMTLTDRMGREVEGGSGWGTHVYP